MARRLGDRTGLATVLMRSYWSRGTSALEEILEMVTEARDLAAVLGNTEIQAEAMAWRVPALVALGEVDAARREVDELLRMAEQTAQPFIVHVAEHYGSAIALCDGRLEAAEAMAHRSHEWSRLLTGRDASGIYGIQMFSVRREQGRLEELAPVVGLLAGDPDVGGPWRPGLVALLAELGMEARRGGAREGRRTRGSIATASRSGSRRSRTSPTRRVARRRRRGGAPVPELEPLAGTNVMIGHLVACYGAADRYLGMLASVLGEAERARAHFEGAGAEPPHGSADLDRPHGVRVRPFLLLVAPADRDRADALLAEAAALADADRNAGAPGGSARFARPACGCPPGRALAPRGRSPASSRAGSATARSVRRS